MRKYLIIWVGLIMQCSFGIAQNNRTEHNNKIERLKIEFMTQKLQLSQSESRAFWPIYNAYYKQIRTAWQKSNGDKQAYEEKAAVIKDKYRKPFVEVLHSHERANNVYKVEKAYWAMLRKELKERNRQ